MNNTDELTSAYECSAVIYQKLISAQMEVSTLNDKVARLTEENNRLNQSLLNTLVDRDMYKQHSLDLAKELEQMREPEWDDDEEDYLPAPAEGCQCSFCIGGYDND